MFFFLEFVSVWRNTKTSLRNKTRILEAKIMTVVKFSSETWGLHKTEQFIKVKCFPEKLAVNCLEYSAD